MNTFSYSPFSKLRFRYASIFLSFILITYLIVLILDIRRQPLLIIPAVINIAVLLLANKFYYNTYKRIPFKIICGTEEITASNFMPGLKTVKIKYSSIDSITGGVFGYNPKGLIYLHDGEQNITICIHPDIENVNSLLKYIIERLNRELRDNLIARLKLMEEKQQ